MEKQGSERSQGRRNRPNPTSVLLRSYNLPLGFLTVVVANHRRHLQKRTAFLCKIQEKIIPLNIRPTLFRYNAVSHVFLNV